MWLVINLHFPCSYYHYYYYYFFFFPKCIIYNFVSCGVYNFSFLYFCVLFILCFFLFCCFREGEISETSKKTCVRNRIESWIISLAFNEKLFHFFFFFLSSTSLSAKSKSNQKQKITEFRFVVLFTRKICMSWRFVSFFVLF